MTTVLSWDIETVPCEAALAEPYPEADRTPPSNYSKPDAIARWYEKDRAEWAEARIKQCSVSPRLGRIVAFGLAGQQYSSIVARTETAEAALITSLWDVLASAKQLVTFAGLGFDWPFLRARSMFHGIPPTVQYAKMTHRYQTWPHCDVRDQLLSWHQSRESGEGLAAWSTFFGLAEKPIPSATVYDAYVAGRFDDIADLAQQDASNALAIYDRLTPYL